ncbi:DMT family transporter [Chitinophaga sp. Hz27]|uniref:DMT family transporter n=1 Tax=Chitinophaga sp. Hz27 TaxID=3347169 RepID=UPI0035DB18B3
MGKKTTFILLLILGTAFWGISFPVTKMAMGNISSSTFLFYRFLFATLALCVALSKQLKLITPKVFTAGAMLAVPLAFGIIFQTMGIKRTPASQCALVAGTSVIIIPVIKLLFYRTYVDLKVWAAALIALSGLMVISLKANFAIGLGDLFTIIGAAGFAVYLIKVEKYAGTKNILPTIIPMFATCTAIACVWAIFDSSANWMPSVNTFWLGIGYCALFSTAYMYTVSNVAQKYIKAEKVAIIYLFEPVFAAIAAITILNESLTWRLLLGGCLIFLGTIISEVNFRRIGKGKQKKEIIAAQMAEAM